MHRECRERFPRHRFQRKPLVSDPGMHHGICVTHVPWCMSGLLTRWGRENVPGIFWQQLCNYYASIAMNDCDLKCNASFKFMNLQTRQGISFTDIILDKIGVNGACATRNFTYLTRGPWRDVFLIYTHQIVTLQSQRSRRPLLRHWNQIEEKVCLPYFQTQDGSDHGLICFHSQPVKQRATE